jgi:hypothetical protein
MATRQEDGNPGPVRGSGSYLADRGYADTEEAKLKFLMANEIAVVVEARGLS